MPNPYPFREREKFAPVTIPGTSKRTSKPHRFPTKSLRLRFGGPVGDFPETHSLRFDKGRTAANGRYMCGVDKCEVFAASGNFEDRVRIKTRRWGAGGKRQC